MNTSFSKESLSSWMNQTPSIPMKSADQSPLQSEQLSLDSFQIGRNELLSGSVNGEKMLSPPKEAKSVKITSLKSRVGGEKLLESLSMYPSQKVLRIQSTDFDALIKVLESFKTGVELEGNSIKKSN